MLNLISHRGPDDEGFFCEKDIGIEYVASVLSTLMAEPSPFLMKIKPICSSEWRDL